MRDATITAIVAEAAIVAGHAPSETVRRLRSASSRVSRGRFTIDAETAEIETPDGLGDRAVWEAWDRIRDRAGVSVRMIDDWTIEVTEV